MQRGEGSSFLNSNKYQNKGDFLVLIISRNQNIVRIWGSKMSFLEGTS